MTDQIEEGDARWESAKSHVIRMGKYTGGWRSLIHSIRMFFVPQTNIPLKNGTLRREWLDLFCLSKSQCNWLLTKDRDYFNAVIDTTARQMRNVLVAIVLSQIIGKIPTVNFDDIEKLTGIKNQGVMKLIAERAKKP